MVLLKLKLKLKNVYPALQRDDILEIGIHVLNDFSFSSYN